MAGRPRKNATSGKRSGRGARRRKAPRAAPAGPVRWYWRWSLAVVLAGAATLAWMSVLTYSPADPPLYAVLPGGDGNSPPASAPASQPATAPAAAAPRMRPDMPPGPPAGPAADGPLRRPGPVRNAAGRVGAYVAYALVCGVGVGSHAALALATLWALVLAVRGRVRAWPMRVAGGALLVVAVSAGAALWSASLGRASLGPPGALGEAVAGWLTGRLAVSGGWVVVVAAALVGVILTAERLLLAGLRLAGLAAGVVGRAAMRAGRWAARHRQERKARRERAVAARGRDGSGAALAVPPGDAAGPGVRSDPVPDIVERIRRRLAPVPARADAPPAADCPGLDGQFPLPPEDLLVEPIAADAAATHAQADRRAEVLRRTLEEFGLAAEVVARQVGPVVTMFELAPAPGVKVSRIASLQGDLARALAAGRVRVVSPLPGRDTVGVEVPNDVRQTVRLRELMADEPPAALPVFLGRGSGGEPVVLDLAAAPHVLLAGTTGSGKSVCMHTVIVSLLMRRRAEEVRLLLIDPKRVEMAAYEGIPHLLCPPVTDTARAAEALAWAAEEMDRRYALLAAAGVRHIAEFRALPPTGEGVRPVADRPGRPRPARAMPYVVILVDELADLMMTAGRDVETHIVRIAQKARAVGIHLVLATQRPSVDVVTGLIKSNMPCRIGFRVASQVASRIVLDRGGAECLLGGGDMLLLPPGASAPQRVQGTFVDDEEIRAVTGDLRSRSGPCYDPRLTGAATPAEATARDADPSWGAEHDRAAEAVAAEGRGSAAGLARLLDVPYARARRILDDLADVGIVGPPEGTRPRPSRIGPDQWRRIRRDVGR